VQTAQIFTKIRRRYSNHIRAQQNSTSPIAYTSGAFAGLANFNNSRPAHSAG
jgi:hypothetical protein